MRYEFTKNSSGDSWDLALTIDEKPITLASSTVKGTEAPKIVYETRFGESESIDTDGDGAADTKVIKNCTDISFDIDNVYIVAE